MAHAYSLRDDHEKQKHFMNHIPLTCYLINILFSVCRLIPRAKICRGVMAKRSIPDQEVEYNTQPRLEHNILEKLYGSNSDVLPAKPAHMPRKNKVNIRLLILKVHYFKGL